MRQNNTNLEYAKKIIGIVCLFAYEIATSFVVYFPPLFGVFFAYMIIEYFKKQQKNYIEFGFGWYLSIAFLLFAEQIHGFYIFSSIIGFFVFFYFVVDWLLATFKHRKFILVIFVFAGYLGVYLVSNVINYILNLTLLEFGVEYLWYVFFESLIAIILFRERIL